MCCKLTLNSWLVFSQYWMCFQSMTGRSTYVELNLTDLFENMSFTAEWSLRIPVGLNPQSLTCLKNGSEVVITSSIWKDIEALNDLQVKKARFIGVAVCYLHSVLAKDAQKSSAFHVPVINSKGPYHSFVKFFLQTLRLALTSWPPMKFYDFVTEFTKILRVALNSLWSLAYTEW